MRRIPALTLWRPWPACFTDLPEDIAKRHENRPWSTNYRGDVYLHAGQRWDSSAFDVANAAERALGGCMAVLSAVREDHPTGIVAVAELVGICSASYGAAHRVCDCGPWSFPGQRHWRFANVRKLPEPVPCAGHQQLWYPPEDVAAAVEQQLAVTP